MESLAFDDTQKLLQGIQEIYTCHNLDTFPIDALRIVDRLVPSDWPLFTLTNTRTGQLSLRYLPNFSGLSPELINVLEQVLSQDRDTHPIAQHMPQTLNGAYKLSDFVSQPELHSLENLYQHFLRQVSIEDQMIFFLPDISPGRWSELAQANTTLTGFILNRPSCSFVERDRLILNLLRPHLFQAYSNAQKFRQLNQNACQLQQSLDYLGTIVFNAEGRVISIAPQAIIWIETYFTKYSYYTQLPDRLWSWVKHQVDSLVHKSDLAKVYRPLRIQQNGRELIVRLVLESDARYLLILEEQTLSSFNSLELLGLSQRETEVLQWLMQGKDNKHIAVQLSIKVGTVRKHLENIYLKLGVGSRTEAISYALAKLGFLQSATTSAFKTAD
jgi:DNA-binding CsgD family transcriptional regulator